MHGPVPVNRIVARSFITSEHFRVSALSGTAIREHTVLPQAVYCHKHSSDSRQPRKTSQSFRRWYTTRNYALNPIFLRLGFAFLFCLICEIHAATFQTFFVKQSSSLAGANNVLTFRIVVSRKVERGDALIFKGLTGTQTQDTIGLSLAGARLTLLVHLEAGSRTAVSWRFNF